MNAEEETISEEQYMYSISEDETEIEAEEDNDSEPKVKSSPSKDSAHRVNTIQADMRHECLRKSWKEIV